MRSIAIDAKNEEDKEDMAWKLEVTTGNMIDIHGRKNKITDEYVANPCTVLKYDA